MDPDAALRGQVETIYTREALSHTRQGAERRFIERRLRELG